MANESEASAAPDVTLDLRGVMCPINFVKTKLQLESMEDGQTLEIQLDDGEPIVNVPRSVKDEGHKILAVQSEDEGEWYRLIVRKQ